MFGSHYPFSGASITIIKSDVTIVKRSGGMNTMSTQFSGLDHGLLGAIESIFKGNRDIDHAIVKVYEEEEEWDDWGMC